MIIKSTYERVQWTFLVTAMTLSTLLLSACGGGNEATDSPTAVKGATTDQAIMASAKAVPGTWTGRAPKYEVINGITVPPEPAPSINNATLAGVDVNGNGVRDDVERKIAAALQPGDTTSFAKSIEYAKHYQSLAINSIRDRSSAVAIAKKNDCNYKLPGIVPSNLLSGGRGSFIETTFNTDSRKANLSSFNIAIGGADGSEVTCDN